MKETLIQLSSALTSIVEAKTEEIKGMHEEFTKLTAIAEKMTIEKRLMEQADRLKNEEENLRKNITKTVREYL